MFIKPFYSALTKNTVSFLSTPRVVKTNDSTRASIRPILYLLPYALSSLTFYRWSADCFIQRPSSYRAV